MKGKISSQGGLELLRGSVMRPQVCPYSAAGHRTCGDWCPRLHEPVVVENYFDEQGSTKVVIEYCNGELVFDQADFQDERPGAELKKWPSC